MKKILLLFGLILLLSTVKAQFIGFENPNGNYVAWIDATNIKWQIVPEVSREEVFFLGTVKFYNPTGLPLNYTIKSNPRWLPWATKEIFLIHKKRGEVYVAKSNLKALLGINQHLVTITAEYQTWEVKGTLDIRILNK
jgi:hypothetical protein